MTEEEWKKEFEVEWEATIFTEAPANLIPIIKIFSKRFYLQGRRKEQKEIEKLKEIIKNLLITDLPKIEEAK